MWVYIPQEEVGQLHEVLAGKEEEVARLQQQLASLDDITPPLSTMPQDLLQAKVYIYIYHV